ncbi:MAG: asparagine synthase (glutamine-hydrolyzing) [Burkholderiales bacterium]
MCGIYGIINPNPKLINTKDVQLGLNKLHHRGPDDEGYLFSYSNNHILAKGEDTIKEFSNLPHLNQLILNNCDFVFGHRRLSIIDISCNGHQPFVSNGYAIVYNGEIYNYIELRNELQKIGYTFNTNSDTEVLLKSYIEWGEECQNKLIGMWAFAIYNPKKREVFLSRDRFGIKPLYYVVKDSMFVFASEIKSLIALPFISREPSIKQVKDYLIYGDQEYLPETMFLNIKRLVNSNFMTITIGSGKIKEKKYYNLNYNLSKEKFSDKKALKYSQKFLEIFTDATRIHLRSDVRIGSSFSGGIDSSSIVYTINNLLKLQSKNSFRERQYTFSAVFPNIYAKYIDESKWIDIVVNDLKLKNIKTEPTLDKLINEIEELVYYQDEPFNSTSIFASFSVMKLPRKVGVKVLLDGQGADEITGGYNYYIPIFLKERLSNPIEFLREFTKIFRLNNDFIHVMRAFFTPLSEKIILKEKLKYLFRKQECLLSEGERMKDFSQVNKRLKDDIFGNLQSLLRYSDRNSMANSIESRVPYLDHRLVEFAMSIPSAYKIHNGWNKYISRMAFSNNINNKIAWRKDKIGFATPEKIWFNDKIFKEFATKTCKNSKLLKELNIVSRLNINDVKLSFLKWRIINLSIWEKVFNL